MSNDVAGQGPALSEGLGAAAYAEIHLRCVINGLEVVLRGDDPDGTLLLAAHRQALCCMDVLIRAQAMQAHADDIAKSRSQLSMTA